MSHRMPGHSRRCDLCGKPLGLRYWVHDRHLRVHEECRPWQEVAWPYRARVRELRRRWREASSPQERQRLGELGVWLRERERIWPDGALETVRGVRERGL